MAANLRTSCWSLASYLRTPLTGNLTPRFRRSMATKVENADQNQAEAARKYIPRRCIMYVPGDDQRKLDKSITLNADSLVFDCEDGVAVNKKEEARHCVQKFIQSLSRESCRSEVGVRINSIGSGLAEEDLKVTLSGEKIPRTLYVPKVQSVEHIDWVAEKLGTYMPKKDKDMNLIIYIESARALLDLRDICRRAQELSEYHLFRLEGVVFGSDDFYADIGATRSNDSKEVLVARQQIVFTAKAFGLQVIDIVYIDYKDSEGLRNQCIEGAKMGFTGKQCIHPGQVDIIQEAFSPSKEKIKWATELIKLFHEHQASGTGAFVFQGSMIDKPLLLQAQHIVQMASFISDRKQ